MLLDEIVVDKLCGFVNKFPLRQVLIGFDATERPFPE